MPPRRSKTKSAVSVNDRAKPPIAVESIKAELLDPSERIGILIFPTETILQILSEVPRLVLPCPYDTYRSGSEYPFYDPAIEAYGEVRSDLLRSLSQTCRPFRKFFLPLLWESVYIYARGGGEVWYKRVSKCLEIISLNLADKTNNSLANCVRSMHVVLTRCSTTTVLPAFAQCLQALPNLHTLEILHAHSQMTTALKDAFENINLPSIKTIMLPSCAHNILRCCSEVTSVTCTEEDGSKLLGAISVNCKKVEIMERFHPNDAMLKRMVKSVPNLRRLSLIAIVGDNHADSIRILKPLKYLSEIRFCLGPHMNEERMAWRESGEPMVNNAKQYRVVEGTKDVLKAAPDGKKSLVALFHWYERHPKQVREAVWYERAVEIPLD